MTIRLFPALLVAGALLLGGTTGCASGSSATGGSGSGTAAPTSGTATETAAGTGTATGTATGAGDSAPTGHESIGDLIAFRALDVISVPADATSREITDNDQYYRLEKLLGVGDGEPLTTIPDDRRRFAFLLSGCEEDSAMVRLNGSTLQAEPIGDDSVDCVRAVHYLAVFDVPTDRLGPEVTVGG